MKPPPPVQPVNDTGTSTETQLELGISEVYRTALLKAKARCSIDAAALAALIDAEAGRIPVGPEKGRWDPRAFNASSGAAGLTQFIASTWIGHAAIAGTALRQAGQAAGLLDAAGRAVDGATEELLQLRFDPTLSIISAAEYGMMNLKGLIAKGLLSAGETDDRKAWFMYLAHHEGLGGASGFLQSTRTYSLIDLERQVGSAKSAALVARHGDANAAYRAWLKGYIDEKIQPGRFRSGGGSPRQGGLASAAARQDEVRAYTGLNAGSAERLRGWAGTPIPFSGLGGDIGLARAI